MQFEKLTKQGEELLNDILKQTQKPTEDYWEERFSNLASREEDRLRSVFAELTDCGLVKILWADDVPSYIAVSNAAHTYFERKKEHEKDKKSISRREWMIAVVSALISSTATLLAVFAKDIIAWFISF